MKALTRAQKTKKTIGKDRRVKAEMPEIYVKINEGWRSNYARASIRVKSGKYQYLMWRDGGRVRYFYLGQKKNS